MVSECAVSKSASEGITYNIVSIQTPVSESMFDISPSHLAVSLGPVLQETFLSE